MSIKIEKWESERTHGTQIAQHIHLHSSDAAWIWNKKVTNEETRIWLTQRCDKDDCKESVIAWDHKYKGIGTKTTTVRLIL